jgi:hypothetical protein
MTTTTWDDDERSVGGLPPWDSCYLQRVQERKQSQGVNLYDAYDAYEASGVSLLVQSQTEDQVRWGDFDDPFYCQKGWRTLVEDTVDEDYAPDDGNNGDDGDDGDIQGVQESAASPPVLDDAACSMSNTKFFDT